jgi:hypothetical protein
VTIADSSYRTRYGSSTAFAPPAAWNDVLAQQLAHRSVRAYRPDPVPDDTLTALIAAAQSAPTSGNLQLWSVVAVRDEARRTRLAELAGEQDFIAQAPLFLVWLAESLGLGTVFVGAIRNRPLDGAAELGLPPNVFPVFGLTVGHPDRLDDAAVKPRLPQQAVLHHETYELEPQEAHVHAYEQALNTFYANAGLPTSWVARVAARFGTVAGLKGREHLREALHIRGFELR